MASSIMESLFQRTLEDLVKGLRVQLIGENRYIATHLEEIRKEVKSADAHTKTVALQKLTYLNMIHGVDMEWAAFHVVEAMSMTKFAHKKIGYLAASRSFHEGTDVLLLITNQLRKDLNSTNEYESALALECLSCIATPDLARELTPELFTLLASGKAYVRKKATLTLLRFFSKYPDAVRIAFKRLVEKLEDPDAQVVSAAVSILCEMAIKDPVSYLPLAPEFYRLLMDSKNNWVMIKIVKIFGVLAPLEPRLGRKIAEPLCELMRKTSAKSLLLECIRTVIAGLADHMEAMKLALEKLKELVEEDDPNLKYLGLQALASLMPAHPWAVAENKSVIIQSLSDEDHSIQIAALQLILGMVADNNIIDTVQVLLQYAERSEPSFCNELIGSILSTCSRGLYELVPDFSWYVSVLGNISRIPDSTHGRELERQFVDIGLRVKEVRKDLLNVARGILLDPTLLEHSSLHRVLSAVAWIAGEYTGYSDNPSELIEALLQPRTRLLPSSVQAVYVQAILKVFVHFSFLCLNHSDEHVEAKSIVGQFSSLDLEGERDGSSSCNAAMTATPASDLQHVDLSDAETFFSKVQNDVSLESLHRILELIDLNVGSLAQSMEVEVRERACNLLGVVEALRGYLFSRVEVVESSKDQHGQLCRERAYEMIKFLREIFCQELGPVSVFAQGRVVVPDGLVLGTTLDSLDCLLSEEESLEEKEKGWSVGVPECRELEGGSSSVKKTDVVVSNGESDSLLAQHRQQHGTYYLPVDKNTIKGDEYPPPILVHPDHPSTSAAPEDIMKLAEQSLLWTKTRRTKPRPVVVRLDDGDESLGPVTKTKKDLKDNFISNAIRDVLEGDKSRQLGRSTVPNVKESVQSNTSLHHHRKSHGQSRRQEKKIQPPEGSHMSAHEGACVDAEALDGKSNKHRRTKQAKGTPTISEGEQVSKGRLREQQRSGRRSRHRIKSPASLSLQTPIIPDFLL